MELPRDVWCSIIHLCTSGCLVDLCRLRLVCKEFNSIASNDITSVSVCGNQLSRIGAYQQTQAATATALVTSISDMPRVNELVLKNVSFTDLFGLFHFYDQDMSELNIKTIAFSNCYGLAPRYLLTSHSLTSGSQLLHSLTQITINNCNELTTFPRLPNTVQKLCIKSCAHLCCVSSAFTECIDHIQKLNIVDCPLLGELDLKLGDLLVANKLKSLVIFQCGNFYLGHGFRFSADLRWCVLSGCVFPHNQDSVMDLFIDCCELEVMFLTFPVHSLRVLKNPQHLNFAKEILYHLKNRNKKLHMFGALPMCEPSDIASSHTWEAICSDNLTNEGVLCTGLQEDDLGRYLDIVTSLQHVTLDLCQSSQTVNNSVFACLRSHPKTAFLQSICLTGMSIDIIEWNLWATMETQNVRDIRLLHCIFNQTINVKPTDATSQPVCIFPKCLKYLVLKECSFFCRELTGQQTTFVTFRLQIPPSLHMDHVYGVQNISSCSIANIKETKYAIDKVCISSCPDLTNINEVMHVVKSNVQDFRVTSCPKLCIQVLPGLERARKIVISNSPGCLEWFMGFNRQAYPAMANYPELEDLVIHDTGQAGFDFRKTWNMVCQVLKQVKVSYPLATINLVGLNHIGHSLESIQIKCRQLIGWPVLTQMPTLKSIVLDGNRSGCRILAGLDEVMLRKLLPSSVFIYIT